MKQTIAVNVRVSQELLDSMDRCKDVLNKDSVATVRRADVIRIAVSQYCDAMLANDPQRLTGKSKPV